MSPSLGLLQNRLVALRVNIMYGSGATGIEEKLGLVEIFFFSCQCVETGQRHLGYLVSRHHLVLPDVGTYLLHYAIGITLGDIQELGTARGLIMGAGGIHHVPEVVKLMAQHLHLTPSGVARPAMGMLGVDGACGIEIAVWLLGSPHHIEHTVDVSHHLLVGIGLEDIAGTLDGLVHIGVVEGETHKRAHVPCLGVQSLVAGMLQGIGSHLKVLVAVFALTLAESQWYRHLTCSLQSVAPEGTRSNLHTGKRHLGIGIAIRNGSVGSHREYSSRHDKHCSRDHLFHSFWRFRLISAKLTLII